MNIESISNKSELKECIRQIDKLIAQGKISDINDYKAMGLRVQLIDIMNDIDYEYGKRRSN